MFETLFGSEMPLAARFFIAFLVVLALIGLTAWLVRRFGANRLGGAGTRGRQPRLAVIDAATVDGRRRLVLIRRDKLEQIFMIGGPTDVVVEPNIVRALGAGAREMTREPGRVTVSTDITTRQSPALESTWPLQPSGEPTSIPAPRPYRSPATEEPWLAPEPGARPRPADSLTGLAAELSARLNPPDHGTPHARSEPAPRTNATPPVTTEPAAPAQNDHNLAEMAQQLEAALRRAPITAGRPPVTDPLAADAVHAPGKGADMPPRTPPRDFKSRVEPKFDAKREPKFEPAAAPGKNPYDNLEAEMASLLGRPSGKT